MLWPFGEKRHLITRGQLHSYIDKPNDDIEYVNVYAMNQWKTSSTAWKNIETDKTSILSQELTDNANRVSKWAIQSILAGADSMKLVFVTRQKLADNSKHRIVGKNKIVDMYRNKPNVNSKLCSIDWLKS